MIRNMPPGSALRRLLLVATLIVNLLVWGALVLSPARYRTPSPSSGAVAAAPT